MTIHAHGSGPAVLAQATVDDVCSKLEGIIVGLPAGAPFAADHPDVRALVDAGQIPARLIGSAFSLLAHDRLIRPVDFDRMHIPTRNGGRALRWEVA